MKDVIQRVIEAVLLLAIVYMLAGCSTAQGLLKDVEWTSGRLADNITVEHE